jgi:hypothetical protein
MIRGIGLVSGVAAVLLLGATASASAGTLDQQQTSSNTNAGIFSSVSGAQTFTAGITGGLDRADLLLSALTPIPEPLTVEIRNASAGEPGTSVLASGSIPNSAIGPNPPAFVPVTFATPAAVTAGTRYTLVAYTTHAVNDSLGWYYQSDTDPYSRGALFSGGGPVPPVGPWNDQEGDDDFGFKTYVAPAPPSPASPSTPTSTGQRAAALKKCKKKAKKKHWSKKKLKKCKKKARLLPV